MKAQYDKFKNTFVTLDNRGEFYIIGASIQEGVVYISPAKKLFSTFKSLRPSKVALEKVKMITPHSLKVGDVISYNSKSKYKYVVTEVLGSLLIRVIPYQGDNINYKVVLETNPFFKYSESVTILALHLYLIKTNI